MYLTFEQQIFLRVQTDNQKPINTEESGGVMKLFFKYDVLQELNAIHITEKEVNAI